MPLETQHFVLAGPRLKPSDLEALKLHVWRNRGYLFIVWYDPRFKGDPFLARLASDLSSCDVQFKPAPSSVPANVISEYGDGQSRPSVPWASSADMLRAWTLEKGGGYYLDPSDTLARRPRP